MAKIIGDKRGNKIERARDLFDQALEKCPPKSSKPLFLMYAQMEEDHGLARRAMSIYEKATQSVADEDKFEVRGHGFLNKSVNKPADWDIPQMFTVYIAKATANFGLPATRPIYERALEVLPDRQTAEMCLRFAALERKLGEIDRARAIYAHASQFCDPRVNPQFWAEWKQFEVDTGSIDTFREMLRIRRSVQAQFNTESSYLAAQAMAARQGAGRDDNDDDEAATADAMAAAEKQANGVKGPAFVAAKRTEGLKGAEEPTSMQTLQANVDEIHISDDEDI
jgi:pre-mRNA-splicing factor SYF1